MTALGLLALALTVSLTVFGTFAYVDARAAFDHDPDTHTASERIQAWRRKSLARSALLSLVLGLLAVIALYLFAHLVLEVV